MSVGTDTQGTCDSSFSSISNKPNPNQISVNSVKASVVNGTGTPGQSPGAGRACESCYSKCCKLYLAGTHPGQQGPRECYCVAVAHGAPKAPVPQPGSTHRSGAAMVVG